MQVCTDVGMQQRLLAAKHTATEISAWNSLKQYHTPMRSLICHQISRIDGWMT